jgi:hypothetical protein
MKDDPANFEPSLASVVREEMICSAISDIQHPSIRAGGTLDASLGEASSSANRDTSRAMIRRPEGPPPSGRSGCGAPAPWALQ